MQYGSILKACREREGLSQEEIAHELHIQQADVSRLENNRKEPSISLFQSWVTITNSQDVLVAFICGVDGMTILTEIMNVTAGFINFLGATL